MASTPPILSLSTLVHRPTVAIDGKQYELRTSEEFAWMIYRGKADAFRKAGQLLQLRKRSVKQEKELSRLLVPLVQGILVAPPAVLARLSDDQRFQILTVFSRLLQTPARTVGATPGRSASASSTKTKSASK